MGLKRSIKRILRTLLSLSADKYTSNINVIPASQILKDKIILLTGSTGGIGTAFAEAFIQAGANVILAGRNISKLNQIKKRLISNYSCTERIEILALDQCHVNTFSDKFNEAISFYGRIDALVNNAGVMGATIPDANEEIWDTVINTNLRGPFFLSQLALNYFKAKNIRGNILNISSSSSLRPAYSAYSLSKWGIRGLTLGLAKLGCKYGITVNAIAPGPTATPMLGQYDTSDLTLPQSPIGRYIHPKEIASMAVFLLSNNGRSIVGDTIYMTGGAGMLTFDDDEISF